RSRRSRRLIVAKVVATINQSREAAALRATICVTVAAIGAKFISTAHRAWIIAERAFVDTLAAIGIPDRGCRAPAAWLITAAQACGRILHLPRWAAYGRALARACIGVDCVVRVTVHDTLRIAANPARACRPIVHRHAVPGVRITLLASITGHGCTQANTITGVWILLRTFRAVLGSADTRATAEVEL